MDEIEVSEKSKINNRIIDSQGGEQTSCDNTTSINDIIQRIKNNIQTEEEYNLFLDHLHQYLNLQESQLQKSLFFEKHINNFFQNNSIYFCKTSKLYFNYVNDDYVVCNEDNILYYILDFLSNDKSVSPEPIEIQTKQQIKNKIVRYIRDSCNIFENIPETETIQNVMNFLIPTVFSEREYAKFFLTCIGDIILKKEKMVIYTRNNLKDFINELNKVVSMYLINTNLHSTFKYKFVSEHDNKIKFNIPCNSFNYEFIKTTHQLCINILCVAIYYSNRFNSACEFANKEGLCDNVNKTINLFNLNTKETIITSFINTELVNDSNQLIHEKDIWYLWKSYIERNSYFVTPFLGYSDFMSCIFKECNLDYDPTHHNNELTGFYSLDIPNVNLFVEFWNKHFTYDEHEIYLEINEILYLFIKTDKRHKKYNFNESLIKYIIQSNFPNINIVNKKYIHNIKCDLWDKKEEINTFVSTLNKDINELNNNQLYLEYCKKCKPDILKIGKKYFNLRLNELRK